MIKQTEEERKLAKKQWRKNNPDKEREYCRKYYAKNKKQRYEDGRKRFLMNKFGITIEEYNNLFEKQKGCCAICGIHQNKLDKKLAVDHGHETGEIRGLLCTRCNLLLGNVNDDISILINSIQYLNDCKTK